MRQVFSASNGPLPLWMVWAGVAVSAVSILVLLQYGSWRELLVAVVPNLVPLGFGLIAVNVVAASWSRRRTTAAVRPSLTALLVDLAALRLGLEQSGGIGRVSVPLRTDPIGATLWPPGGRWPGLPGLAYVTDLLYKDLAGVRVAIGHLSTDTDTRYVDTNRRPPAVWESTSPDPRFDAQVAVASRRMAHLAE